MDRLVAPPVQTTEIIDAARRKLLDANWDLGVVVTDLPLRVGRRPVSRQVSPTHGIAVVSLPALGALHLAPRLRRTLLELVGELVGDRDGQWGGDGALARLRRRWGRDVLQELATDTADRPGALRFLLIAEVLSSHLRLLLGMVRANRPWRLAARLYRALLAAVVASAYGLVTSDIWRISASAGSTRLALASIASISFTSGAVIVAHGLWERAPDRRLRDQVILFNFATAATVLIGIATLYVALFLLIFAAAELLLSPDALGAGLGHAVGTGDYATLAWFTASLATVGGALGAGLESDEAVREAAYASSSDSDEDASFVPQRKES
ncbi:MAG: hypothetical protein E6G08_16845 [Actinobacteria bacterium]|nr:MAG: hypothetical protein E6G08_16845 [Actinomycetota bacterium]